MSNYWIMKSIADGKKKLQDKRIAEWEKEKEKLPKPETIGQVWNGMIEENIKKGFFPPRKT